MTLEQIDELLVDLIAQQSLLYRGIALLEQELAIARDFTAPDAVP